MIDEADVMAFVRQSLAEGLTLSRLLLHRGLTYRRLWSIGSTLQRSVPLAVGGVASSRDTRQHLTSLMRRWVADEQDPGLVVFEHPLARPADPTLSRLHAHFAYGSEVYLYWPEGTKEQDLHELIGHASGLALRAVVTSRGSVPLTPGCTATTDDLAQLAIHASRVLLGIHDGEDVLVLER
jgi:hypothetical protein